MGPMIGCWFVFVVGAFMAHLLFSHQGAMLNARVSANREGLRMSCLSDGPILITHLTDGVSKTTQLNPPLAIIESGGVRLSKAEFDRLTWVDSEGHPTSPAPPEKVQILYLRRGEWDD